MEWKSYHVCIKKHVTCENDFHVNVIYFGSFIIIIIISSSSSSSSNNSGGGGGGSSRRSSLVANN